MLALTLVPRRPERDDFAGLDMRGKVALVLANDPDFEADRDLGFEGHRLTIAGRVGSKFAAAAKAGAVGVLVIHEDAAASYPFSQVAQTLPAMVPAPAAAGALKTELAKRKLTLDDTGGGVWIVRAGEKK